MSHLVQVTLSFMHALNLANLANQALSVQATERDKWNYRPTVLIVLERLTERIVIEQMVFHNLNFLFS